MTDVSPPPPDPAQPEARPRGRRRRFVWRWSRRFLAVVAAIVASVFVTFFSIDIGQFGQLKSLAEREGSKYLERPLTIGKLVAYVTPGRFAVEDVVIQGVKPTDRPFFTAKRITFEIDWWNFIWNHDLPVNVRLTGWNVFIESWGGGRHNLPKLKPKSSGGKRPFTITTDVEALNGAFGFEDHATPWSVTAPNLSFSLVHSRPTNEYVGTAAFSGGTVQIQKFLPMSAALTTRFVLAGGLVDLRHIDLVTDGARTHVTGAVDFSRWPEQRYNVSSELDFRRMRELFFANEPWDVDGKGDFTGIFHVYNGGQELAGDFKSAQARVQSLDFSDLHGSLQWLPDRFEVTHADADFHGGHTRFTYAIEPLGTPAGATQRFTAELDDASLASVAGLMDLKNLRPTGRIRHAHATMAWPSGKFRTDVRGSVEADVSPPVEGQLATLALPALGASPPRLLDIPKKDDPNKFDPMKPLGPLPVGGHLEFTFDGTTLAFAQSTVATPTTYFAFSGQTDYGQNSNVAFHVTSLDWQESDRLLAAIMTAAGSTTGAVQLGGRGTFDGVLTKSFKDPRIAGRFSGDAIQAFYTTWGKVSGDAVIENRYIDVTNGVIGDDPETASIRTSGRYSLGYPRADGLEEVRAHVAIRNWPLEDLRHGFDLDDWPVDGMIASADMDINGPYTGLFGSGLMQLVDGVAWKEHFESAQGALTLTGNGISIDRIAMTKSSGRMTGAAVVKWDGTYSFDAKGDQIKVESLDNFKVEKAPLTGVMAFTASGAGAFSAPHYEFGGTIKDLYAADEFVGEVTGHLRVDNNRLTIDQFNTSSFRLQVTGSGQIVLDDQYDAELTLKFLDTSIDPYLKFFAPRMSPYTRAIASGTVRVSGPLADYEHLGVFLTGVEGTLTLFDYQLKNDGPISLTFQDNAVSIGRFRLTGEGTNLELSGGMSVADSTINLQANGDASLAILQGPNMHGAGRAVLRASATGSFSDPSISGYADIEGGSFRYRPLPRSFTDIVGRVNFDGNAVSLDGLKAKFGDGDVKFAGNIGLKSFLPDQFNLSATGTAMRLRYPEGFSSTVNADLSLSGPVAAPQLSGRVDVLYAAYTQTIDTDAGIVMLAAGAAGGATTEEGLFEAIPEASYPLTFNIQIRANHTLHIDNRKTATLVGSADLSYRGTLDRPSLTGHIDIDSGEVFINGNRFKVLPGTIQFSNPNKLDPFFDISAETRPRAQGQTFNVNVHLTGTRASLTPTFSSDPFLSTVDIITLIFGGVPDVSSTQQRSITSQQQAYTTLVQSAAAQFLLSPVSSRVGSVIERTGVDTVQFTTILPNESSFNQLSPSTRVTVGKRLSRNLYMTYARDLNSSQYEVILVEFEQSERISWILSRNEDRTFALDFRVRHVF
ncbi:MAG TPA: translocation/assembly module TamB domain-containing protein [Vicinamibacterales bacterium]|nr:translocation/assembly module TamB domain-containing protein [Vicinamibacterales bacterium]